MIVVSGFKMKTNEYYNTQRTYIVHTMTWRIRLEVYAQVIVYKWFFLPTQIPKEPIFLFQSAV